MNISPTLKTIASAVGNAIDISSLDALRRELLEAQLVAESANRRVAILETRIDSINRRLRK